MNINKFGWLLISHYRPVNVSNGQCAKHCTSRSSCCHYVCYISHHVVLNELWFMPCTAPLKAISLCFAKLGACSRHRFTGGQCQATSQTRHEQRMIWLLQTRASQWC